MALPTIQPYPMPTAADLPADRVTWQVDPGRAVLLVHDLQNHFLDPFPDGASPRRELLHNVARLKEVCARLSVPVLYSAQPGGQTPAQRGLQQDFWGPGLPGGDPRAAAVADEVAPGPDDVVLTKWKYSAFVRTDLAERMAAQGRDQLVITGVYAHIGVQATACDAWMRDIRAFVVADAVADFGPREHRQALAWCAGRAARVLTTDELVALDAAPDEAATPLTLDRVRADVADVLGEDPAGIADDDNLADAGLDSVRLMALVERWRTAHGIDVSFVELAERPGISAWWQLLEGRA